MWAWLENYNHTWGMWARVIVKAALLFALVNVAFALLDPIPALGRLAVYNTLVPGRERLPYGENPDGYNLSLNSLDAMFASHQLAAAPDDVFRVLIVGDSSVWGVLLSPAETVAGQINARDLTVDGRPVHAYNIGHPLLSVTKDLLLLDYALRYEPDMVIWFVTLDALYRPEQFSPLGAPGTTLTEANADRVRDLITEYHLDLDADALPPEDDFWSQTLVGQRRALADWLRLQRYGFSWSATGIDSVDQDYDPLTRDFSAEDDGWKSRAPEDGLSDAVLAWDVVEAGLARVSDVPLILVNEPIFIADGRNSDLRYNAWYPRWAYDAYHADLRDFAAEQDAPLVDLWDAVPPDAFTDSPVHYAPEGVVIVVDALVDEIAVLD